MIFDTHAHYDDRQFEEDREELLGSMRENGVELIVDAASDIASWDKIEQLTDRYPFIYGAIGVHPDEVGELDEEKMKRMEVWNLRKSCYRNLSGGQQQRTLLARALCAASKVILLDEPVTGLDPKVTAEFYQVTKDLSEEGIAVIMVSHDVQALDYATHILHMQKKNSFYGTKEEYMNSDKWKLFKNAEENRIGGDKK